MGAAGGSGVVGGTGGSGEARDRRAERGCDGVIAGIRLVEVAAIRSGGLVTGWRLVADPLRRSRLGGRS